MQVKDDVDKVTKSFIKTICLPGVRYNDTGIGCVIVNLVIILRLYRDKAPPATFHRIIISFVPKKSEILVSYHFDNQNKLYDYLTS